MPPETNIETLVALLAERQRAADHRLDKQDQTMASIAETLKTLSRIESQAQATQLGFIEFREEMREFRKERLSAEKAMEADTDKLTGLVTKLDARLTSTEEVTGWVKKALGVVVLAVLASLLALLKLHV